MSRPRDSVPGHHARLRFQGDTTNQRVHAVAWNAVVSTEKGLAVAGLILERTGRTPKPACGPRRQQANQRERCCAATGVEVAAGAKRTLNSSFFPIITSGGASAGAGAGAGASAGCRRSTARGPRIQAHHRRVRHCPEHDQLMLPSTECRGSSRSAALRSARPMVEARGMARRFAEFSVRERDRNAALWRDRVHPRVPVRVL